MNRFLFYSHDALGLGHIRRTMAVAGHLVRRFPDSSALIITGSHVATRFPNPDGIDFVKLPTIRKVRNDEYVSRDLDLAPGEILSLRSATIRSVFESFRPDVFIVDKHPAGVGGELSETLEASKGTGTKWVLSLRDILDNPDTVISSWQKSGDYEVLENRYDKILVWGMRDLYDPTDMYRFSPAIKNKVTFCGYINRFAAGGVKTDGKSSDQALVLATSGGGEDGLLVLEQFIRSLSYTTAKFASVIVFGPYMSESHKARLRRLMARTRGNVFAVDFTNRLERFVRSADLVVSMAGYNTVSEILAAKTRAILVPRVEPRVEQLIRARRLMDRGLATMLHPEHLTPELMALAVDLELSKGRPVTRPEGLDFSGLNRALDELAPYVTAHGPSGKSLDRTVITAEDSR